MIEEDNSVGGGRKKGKNKRLTDWGTKKTNKIHSGNEQNS